MNMRVHDTQQSSAAASPAPPVRVLVADDHRVVVMGIARTLEAHADIEVAACAHSVAELMTALHDARYDVLLCDYSFNDSDQPDGMPMLQRIRRLWPDLKILLLTSQDDMTIINHVVQLGVTGFLSKRSGDFADLAAIVRNAARGVRYMDKTSQAMVAWFLALSAGRGDDDADATDAADVADETRASHAMHATAGTDATAAAGQAAPAGTADMPAAAALRTLSVHDTLSATELDLARLFASGVTLSEIAQANRSSLKEVCARKQSVMQKLGVGSDVELVSVFRQLQRERR